jgi:hypothetical protein
VNGWLAVKKASNGKGQKVRRVRCRTAELLVPKISLFEGGSLVSGRYLARYLLLTTSARKRKAKEKKKEHVGRKEVRGGVLALLAVAKSRWRRPGFWLGPWKLGDEGFVRHINTTETGTEYSVRTYPHG